MKYLILSGVIFSTTLGYSDEKAPAGNSDVSMRKNAISTNQQQPWSVTHQSYDNSIFLEADFIYWNVTQEGNNYVAAGISNTNSLSISQGYIYRPPSKMTPGFKVAVGVNLDKDMWDVVTRYTWFHSHSYGITPLSDNFNSDTTMIGLLSNLLILNQATADFTIHFNALDAELGRNFYLSPSFYIRTWAGLKGVWLKEELEVNYTVALQPVVRNEVVQYVQNYWGLGPRVGATGMWWLYKTYLGLFAETAFSALWSGVDLTTSNDNLPYTIPGSETPKGYLQPVTKAGTQNSNQRYHMHTLIPAFELSLGLQTEWMFQGGSRLVASAAWETQMFLFMAQHSSTIADLNLNMEGFTLKFRYDF